MDYSIDDPKVSPAKIEEDLRPLSAHLRELTDSRAVQAENGAIRQTLEGLNGRVAALSEVPLRDYEFAAQLRTLAKELRESEVGPLVSSDVTHVEKLASRYQTEAALNRGI